MTLSSFANKLFFKWKRFILFLTATMAAMQTMATHCSILAGHVYFFVKIISFSLRSAVSDRQRTFSIQCPVTLVTTLKNNARHSTAGYTKSTIAQKKNDPLYSSYITSK